MTYMPWHFHKERGVLCSRSGLHAYRSDRLPPNLELPYSLDELMKEVGDE